MRPTDFSPAEALYLLFGEKVSTLSLVKATVLDLAYHNVLAISPDPASPELHKARISAGPALGSYKPTPFEAPFLTRFSKVPDWRPTLRFYSLDLMRKPYSSVVKCLTAIHSDRRFRAYIVDNFFWTLFGGYRANKSGAKVAGEIRISLREGLDLLTRGRADEASARMGRLAVLLDLPEVDRGIQLPTDVSAPGLLRQHAALLLGSAFLLPLGMDNETQTATLFGAFDQAINPPAQKRKPASELEDGDDSYIGSDSGYEEDDDSDDDGSDGYDGDSDGSDGGDSGSDGGGDSGCSGCGGGD